jgi:hypothetical protein
VVFKVAIWLLPWCHRVQACLTRAPAPAPLLGLPEFLEEVRGAHQTAIIAEGREALEIAATTIDDRNRHYGHLPDRVLISMI